MSPIVFFFLASSCPLFVGGFRPRDSDRRSSSYYSPSIYPIVSYVSNPYEVESSPSTYQTRSHSLTTSHLMSSPSIVSAAQVPFVFGRKKGKRGPSIVRNKPVYSTVDNRDEDDRPTRVKLASTSSSSSTDIDWSSADMMQHPIDEEARKSNRSLGQPCSYSSDCGSGCCLLDRTTKIRSCQPLALLQEKCTNSQVKGDLYVDACPCSSGSQFCTINQRCSW